MGTLTIAHMKYLLTLRELSPNGERVRCVEVAQLLRVTKPSMHTMMNTLKERKFVEKTRYGMVYLTPQDREISDLYGGYYETIRWYLDGLLTRDADARTAAYALLTVLPDNSVAEMCSRMRGDINELS